MVRRPIRIETHFPRDPRRSLSRLPWRAIALSMATLLLGLGGTAVAQPHDLATPVDSPLWWTLTDQVTTAELKALYSDRSLSLARYQDAVAAGLATPLSREAEGCLEFYLNRQLTPELEPMWLAFRTFYTFHTPGEHARDEAVESTPAELQEYGVSPAGINVILDSAIATAAEVDGLMAVLGPKQNEMSQLLLDAYADPARSGSLPPQGQLYDAVLQREYETVAVAVGLPASEIPDLVDSHADWNAPYALVAEALPELQEDLTVADWQAFRQYLLGRIVARKGSSLHFGPACGGQPS